MPSHGALWHFSGTRNDKALVDSLEREPTEPARLPHFYVSVRMKYILHPSQLGGLFSKQLEN